MEGTTAIGDTSSSPFGFNLTGAETLGGGEKIDLYGRIVGAEDNYEFTSDIAFTLSFIFEGYTLADSGLFVAESGFVREGSKDNTAEFSLEEIVGGSLSGSPLSTTFTTNVTGSSGLAALIFSGGPGRYNFAIDGKGKAALYDVRISAVPLPASALLMIAGLAAFGVVRRKQARS